MWGSRLKSGGMLASDGALLSPARKLPRPEKTTLNLLRDRDSCPESERPVFTAYAKFKKVKKFKTRDMLSIDLNTGRSRTCTPNVLPCRVHHNGPVNATERYWSPSTGDDGKQVAYFRGRKLHGRCVQIPDGYRGVVLKSTDRTVSQGGIQGEISQADKVVSAEHEEDEDEDEAINVIEEQASFDKVVLWGHESTPDGNDPYAKGIEEWISFAETMHSTTDLTLSDPPIRPKS
ncbi:3'-5' exonuclease [Acarospora aff. strigata]|nr:3'-5' exonuclease [Acarospora aff. strigata]